MKEPSSLDSVLSRAIVAVVYPKNQHHLLTDHEIEYGPCFWSCPFHYGRPRWDIAHDRSPNHGLRAFRNLTSVSLECTGLIAVESGSICPHGYLTKESLGRVSKTDLLIMAMQYQSNGHWLEGVL